MPWDYFKRTGNNRQLDFCEIVDAVIKQQSGVGVEKMEVNYALLTNDHADHIDKWLNFAIASKTKQLILDLTTYSPQRELIKELYKFPFQFFDATNSLHLQSVKLCCVSLHKGANFEAFRNLKKLELEDVDITDEELQLLLSNCIVLEYLGISFIRTLRSLRMPHPSKHFKHLFVSYCLSLQEIDLNSGLKTLEYEGPLIPLTPPGTLTNVSVKSSDISSALVYISTELPSTVPRLEMLTLKCEELERVTLPEKHPKFVYLRHLRLEITFSSLKKRRTDVLDFAPLLEALPFMEKLEFHMWMDCHRMQYHKCHGELRSLPPNPHSRLKLVDITGFYGQKDQLELALHILRNSMALERMKIDPKPMVAADAKYLTTEDGRSFVEGYKVGKKYLRKADHRGVLDLIKVRSRDVENTHIFTLVCPLWIERQEKIAYANADPFCKLF